jgi:Fe2+ transport system protein FeoA
MISRLRLRARLRAQRRRQAHMLHQEHELNCSSLCCGKRGDALRVLMLTGDDTEAARLRDLGVREGARVVIVRDGDPLMIKVDNARFGISRTTANHVHCEFCKPD